MNLKTIFQNYSYDSENKSFYEMEHHDLPTIEG